MSRAIYALVLLLWSPFATSCDEFFNVGDNQVKETQVQIASAGELDYDAILAFERLLCADRGFVRSFAVKIGLSSGNTTIRSRALLSALMEKETITLEPYFEEGISKTEKEFIQNNSMLPFGVTFRSQNQSCISLWSKTKCEPNFSVSVEGDEVTLRYERKVARLTLTEEGELEGIYTEGASEAVRVPVRIKLL